MTSEESFAIYEAIIQETYPYGERDLLECETFPGNPKVQELNGLRYSLWCDDKLRREKEAIENLIPRQGLPCTIWHNSDRKAATVTEILSDRKVSVRYNKVECIDYYAGKYDILPELESEEIIFVKEENGKWTKDDHHSNDDISLKLHYQAHYVDPYFDHG